MDTKYVLPLALLAICGLEAASIDIASTTLSVTLTQSDTLAFDDDEKLEMQIRFVFTNGSVDATQIIKGKIGRILKDGEIDVD